MSRSSARTALRVASAAVALAAVAAVGGTALSQTAVASGAPQNFIVLAPQGQGVAAAVARVQANGGTVLASYDAIGVLIASSDRTNFATAVVGAGVQSAAATTGLGTAVETPEEATVAVPDPATTSEAMWPLQWDMHAIQAAEAHSVTIGSPDVVVGVLDSGIDATHPDLASQVDHSLSASCVGGVPDTSFGAWNPTGIDHGTHVAGTIGAARNGVGIVGVAPGVRLASVKVVTDDGFIYPEAAVCGFMWAAEHGFDITNNSYFIDPWQLNCRNDVRQRPIWIAVQRALRHSAGQGVLNVASAGNSRYDLQHTFIDPNSPNDGSAPVEERVVNGACLVLPAEAPGVLTVSATGPTGIKSFYSSYGLGAVEVAAPGGDSRVRGDTLNGGVLSAVWPAAADGSARWGYKQGTSMAAPHASGVAALIRSLHPDMSPSAVTGLIQRTADAQACPVGREYTPPGEPAPHVCYGGTPNNGFYGHGEVNAYRAVTG
jgi:subtilisin family serine protease